MGIPPPRVFWKKRLQSVENKGQEREKERQESSRGGKRLEIKEIEEAEFLKEFGRGVWRRRETVKRRLGEHSRQMVPYIIEIVNK
jgi:hypothetical protein